MSIQQPQPLEVVIETETVKLSGEVSVKNITKLHQELYAIAHQIKVIDCQQLQSVDSSFLAFLLWLQAVKHRLGTGSIIVRHTSEALKTLRQLYDLEKILVFEG
ncbi:STAS domain-containing protein [Galenea microaerophila]